MAPIPHTPNPPKIPATLVPHIAPPPCTRRLSLAFFAAAPILDAVTNEARLWREEAALYARRGGAALSGALPRPPPAGSRSQRPLNPEFASNLLFAVLTAAGTDAKGVAAAAKALQAKELPAFQEAGACGHCGTETGPSALKDRDFFDFQSYALRKALLQRRDPTAAAAAVGDAILLSILDEVDVGEAEAVGISPFRAFAAASADLLSASPDLDSIRLGVAALLRYFERKGFVAATGVSRFGISFDEFENHEVWARGEPAYLQYWLVSPADLRSTGALQGEGATAAGLSFVGAAVMAYLRRCGVECEGLRRTASLTDPEQVAEQMTLRRVKPLQRQGGGGREARPWRPDPCPGGGEGDCV